MIRRLLRLCALPLVFLATLPSALVACPYCAGQDGGDYISQIFVPIMTLLGAPFILFGIMAFIVARNSDKKTDNRPPPYTALK